MWFKLLICLQDSSVLCGVRYTGLMSLGLDVVYNVYGVHPICAVFVHICHYYLEFIIVSIIEN